MFERCVGVPSEGFEVGQGRTRGEETQEVGREQMSLRVYEEGESVGVVPVQ